MNDNTTHRKKKQTNKTHTQMGQPADAVATRWGGGCTSTLFGKVCGFA